MSRTSKDTNPIKFPRPSMSPSEQEAHASIVSRLAKALMESEAKVQQHREGVNWTDLVIGMIIGVALTLFVLSFFEGI